MLKPFDVYRGKWYWQCKNDITLIHNCGDKIYFYWIDSAISINQNHLKSKIILKLYVFNVGNYRN